MPTRENKKLERVTIESFTLLPFIISAFDDYSITVGFVLVYIALILIFSHALWMRQYAVDTMIS